jgi:hypothetical protein
MRRALAWTFGVTALIAAGGYAATRLSPWPAALFYRAFMDRAGEGSMAEWDRHQEGRY